MGKGEGPHAADVAEPNVEARAELDVLLKAYELERSDDIQAAASFLTLLTITIALMSLIGFVMVNSESLPGWLVALAPLPPVPLIAFAALYGYLAQIRGRLIDRYESELRRRFPDLKACEVPVPSGHSILGRVWVTRFGRTVIALSAIVLLGLYVGVIVQSFRTAYETEPAFSIVVLVAAIISTGVVVTLFALALFPERLIRNEVKRLTD
jgi:uncharacterized membrane protein (DUF485 family)